MNVGGLGDGGSGKRRGERRFPGAPALRGNRSRRLGFDGDLPHAELPRSADGADGGGGLPAILHKHFLDAVGAVFSLHLRQYDL